MTPHGTLSRYTNDHCRCWMCCLAASEYNRTARWARITFGPPEHLHGTYNAYVNYGCRCLYCCEAHRDWRAAKKEERRPRSADEIREIVDERTTAEEWGRARLAAQMVAWCGSWEERRAEFESLVAPLEQACDHRLGYVLTLRYGIDRRPEIYGEYLYHSKPQRTLAEVGEYFNLTRERIRQLESQALARLGGMHPEEEITIMLSRLVTPPWLRPSWWPPEPQRP